METYIAIFGVILSCIGIGLMFFQYLLMREQKRIMDIQIHAVETQKRLFILEKRYAFYDILLRFLFEVGTYGKVRNEEDGWKFYAQRRLALLLFDAEVAEYIERIVNKLTGNALAPEDKQKEIQDWFISAYYNAHSLFAPYLEPPR